MLHILAAIPYSLVGAFQFAPGLRRRHNAWHRAAGRILAGLGLTVAVTGLWMTLTYPWSEGDGVILYATRLIVGLAMTLSILLALRAVRRRDFTAHGEWMIPGYAIALGAGTQVLTHLPWFILVGTPGELPRAFMMGGAWVINIVIAESVIRRGRRRRAAAPPAGSGRKRTAMAPVQGHKVNHYLVKHLLDYSMRTFRHLAFGLLSPHSGRCWARAHHPTLLVNMLATGILIASFAAAVYCNQLVLIPRLWRTNQRSGYSVALLLTMIVSTVPAVLGIQHVYDVLVGPDPLRYGFWFNLWIDLAGMALHVLVGAAVFGLVDRRRAQRSALFRSR